MSSDRDGRQQSDHDDSDEFEVTPARQIQDRKIGSAPFAWSSAAFIPRVLNTHLHHLGSKTASVVRCVQSDDERIVAGADDGLVRVYDHETGLRMWNLEGHRGAVHGLHLTAKHIATGGEDKSVRVWDMTSGICQERFEGHIAPVLAVALTDRYVVSGSRDHTIKVWDMEKGTCTRTLRGHTGRVCGVQLVRGTTTQFMTCSTDGTVKLWDLMSEQRVRSYKGHKKAVVAFYVTGDDVISSSEDLSMKVWDRRAGTVKSSFSVASDNEVARSIYIDNERIISGDTDGTLRMRAVDSGALLKLWPRHSRPVTALWVDSSAHIMTSASEDGQLVRWDTEAPMKPSSSALLAGPRTLVGDGPSTLPPDEMDAPPAPVETRGPPVPTAKTPINQSILMSVRAGGDVDPFAGSTVDTTWLYGDCGAAVLRPSNVAVTCASLMGTSIVCATASQTVECLEPNGVSVRMYQELDAAASSIHSAGRDFVVGSASGTVRLYSGGSSAPLFSVKQHTGAVTAVRHTGEHIVSASVDRSVIVYDLGGKVAKQASAASEIVCMHAMQTVVVVGCKDGLVGVWNWSSAEPIKWLDGHRAAVTTLHFDDLEVLSGADDGVIKVWDLATGECPRTYETSSAPISALQFDDSKIVVGLMSGDIQIRDMETGETVRTLPGHSQAVTGLVYVANFLVSASRDGSLRSWSFPAVPGGPVAGGGGAAAAKTPTAFADQGREAKPAASAAAPPALTRGGSEDAVVGADGGRRTTPATSNANGGAAKAKGGKPSNEAVDWSTTEVKKRQVNRAKNTPITCLKFDENFIMTGSTDKVVKMWDLNSGQRVRTFRGHTGTVNTLRFTNSLVLSGSEDKSIKIWNAKTGVCAETLDGHAGPVLTLDHNSAFLVSGSRDHYIKVWDLETVKCLRTLKGHAGRVTNIQLSDKIIVSSSTDGTLKLWDVNSPQRIRSFKGHVQAVNCLMFEGNDLVSGSDDNTVKVWDVTTSNCVRTFQGASAGDTALTVQFDPKKIITGCVDGGIRVRDFVTGEILRTLEGHTEAVRCLQYDEARVISGSDDRTLRVWEFAKSGKGCVIS